MQMNATRSGSVAINFSAAAAISDEVIRIRSAPAFAGQNQPNWRFMWITSPHCWGFSGHVHMRMVSASKWRLTWLERRGEFPLKI